MIFFPLLDLALYHAGEARHVRHINFSNRFVVCRMQLTCSTNSSHSDLSLPTAYITSPLVAEPIKSPFHPEDPVSLLHNNMTFDPPKGHTWNCVEGGRAWGGGYQVIL